MNAFKKSLDTRTSQAALRFRGFQRTGIILKDCFQYQTISDVILLLEEKEQGEKLKIKVAEMPAVSQFYSIEACEDRVWHVHDKSKSSPTFEEHLRNLKTDGDKVVTQVVHLEYTTTNNETLITHIDHEIILYTLDEYLKRQVNPGTKGSAGKIKSFKIDGAKIPFDIKHDGEWFLLIVLDAYFENHELIQEIFEDINNGG
ncbi:hypothetical protein V2J84_18485 [Pseudomonas alliivorans]|nr:hypothetical protein [Pseudomonas alliivorans]MEE5055662.1 hypothetical protein [Pseudomonas alliivorans]